jgi:hypothetical protein
MPNGNSDPVQQIEECVSMLSKTAQTDIVLYAGPIKLPGYRRLASLVESFHKNPNILLLLTTGGGDPDSAYRIARCLQRTYASGVFAVFVLSWCKSAGTLIAIGGDQVVMCESAELGPLDVQLSKPDALAEQISGLTPSQAIAALCEQALDAMERYFLAFRFRSNLQITTRTALEIAATLTTGLFGPIFQQIDPMRFGEISRAMLIGEEYGKRLAQKHGVSQRALDALIKNYPSHGFVIDREEATELLQTLVREPTELECKLARLVRPWAERALEGEEPTVEFLSLPQKVELNAKGDTDAVGSGNISKAPSEMPEASGGAKPTSPSLPGQPETDSAADAS